MMTLHPPSRPLATAWIFWAFLFAACEAEVKAPPPADAAVTAAGFGETCSDTAGCLAGLTCMRSEYAALGWCTRTCANVAATTGCEEAELAGGQGFCVEMPSGWNGPQAAFCAPICNKVADCPGTGWETCSKPAYKNTLLYNELPTRTCQSPSFHGQIVVDPVTCDWESKITDPQMGAPKGECKAFCQFVAQCQLAPKSQTANCCAWKCFQHLTPSGKLDNGRLAALKCFTKTFTAFQSTPQVCTAYKEQCGPLP